MIKNSVSLKAKISNLSNETKIPNKYLFQSYMFEAVIKRISVSKYKDNFIIKGGLLLSSIFGVNLRTTMDLDATIKGLSLSKENISNIINEIISIDVNDNIKLEVENIKDIRTEEHYSGFEFNIKAEFDGIKTNLMIDITTGDIITYKEVEFKYNTLFDDDYIDIMSYNYETIIAEKYEAIISRNLDNTRMKDYYDLFMFYYLKWDNINKNLLRDAIINTARNRGTMEFIENSKDYISLIKDDMKIKKLWDSYKNNYEYAKDILFEDTIDILEKIYDVLED